MIELAFELGHQSLNQNSEKLRWELVDRYGMNPSSAQGYIEVVRAMLQGKRYTRTISAKGTEWFLLQIHKNYGMDGLHKAVLSLGEHLDYQELNHNKPQYKIREIYNKYFHSLARVYR